ncbi:hypothetical protein L210DRAFT_855361 [Boletus edulis BED1]|uniref:Uncharacterized protein n=1 Tax=Boletus edulis BED1 TaxID=1328754 RepID=A0AAD4C546_BOLED|nr:hypothetical protein L210DRAFT_855361 [Boletus edulis BED1]
MGFLSLFFKSGRAPTHQSLPPALFPIREHSMSAGAWASSIRDLVESDECRLRRIVHCKANSRSRDEFLLIYIRHPSGKVATVLASRDTTFDPSSAHADEDISLPHPGMDIRALGVAPSRDRIWLSSDGTAASLERHILSSWGETHTVKFPKSKAPSVAHLAVLLTVVHRHVMSPGASAEMRSGWFAYCVAEVMREIFLGESKPNKKWVRVPYGGMKVEGRDTVDALIREFTPAWDKFSRGQVARRGGQRKPKHEEEKKAKKKAEMDSFVHMLRNMES